MLSDGKWYTIKEIRQKMKLNESKIQQILTFLKEYSFILINETEEEIKLEEDVRRFLTRPATS